MKTLLEDDLRRSTELITLVKKDKGLGFNIRGGCDVPYLPGDTGIFVAKVREQGAAAEDGRLKAGDKIVEINGVVCEKVTHDEAVNMFMKDTKTFRLKVIRGAESLIRKYLAETEHLKAVAAESSSTLKVLGMLVLLTGLGVGGYFAWKKYGQ